MDASIEPDMNRDFLWYSCVESSAGSLLILMSELGVVDVIHGDSRAQLLSDAVQRFPHAGLIPAGATHGDWAVSVVKRIELPCYCSVFPIDLGPTRALPLAV